MAPCDCLARFLQTDNQTTVTPLLSRGYGVVVSAWTLDLTVGGSRPSPRHLLLRQETLPHIVPLHPGV